jgi:hypothetical protein
LGTPLEAKLCFAGQQSVMQSLATKKMMDSVVSPQAAPHRRRLLHSIRERTDSQVRPLRSQCLYRKKSRENSTPTTKSILFVLFFWAHALLKGTNPTRRANLVFNIFFTRNFYHASI